MKASRILVPIDFSAGSLRALDYAVELNRTLGGETEALLVVEAVHLSNPGSVLGPGKNLRMLVDEQCRAGQTELEQLKAEYGRKGVEVGIRLELGSPADTICAVAKKDGVGMIVMATHGRTGLSHLILGSVAEHVVRLAPCPVLTIHTYESRPARKRRRQA
jgi:nucleotide-binding universal stress UspA family protein